MIGLGLDLSLRNYATGISYVKANRVLDLTTPFSELTFTLEDKSGEGNDATLYSGRYISTDGSTDRGIVADCSAAGAGNYYLTGKVRPNAVTTAELTMDGSTDSGLTGLTADVWQTFTTATSAVTPSAVQVGYDGSTASAADWSDVKLVDADTGLTVARWQLNESADGDLDGYPALDSSGNGYHGTHTGCAGGTGEAGILQTAGMDWNKRMWFRTTGAYVQYNAIALSANQEFYVELNFLNAEVEINRRLFGQNLTTSDIQVQTLTGGGGYSFFLNGGAKISTGASDSPIGEYHTWRFGYDGANFYIKKDGATIASVAGTYTAISATNSFMLGARGDGSVGVDGMISDFHFSKSGSVVLSSNGYGNTNADWVDTVGSNNGTVNGSPSNLLIPASDATPTNDALGNAIAEPRPTADTWNLFGDGEYGRVADADSLDLTTEATWEIWGNFYNPTKATAYLFDKNGSSAYYLRIRSIISDGTFQFATYSGATFGQLNLNFADGLSQYVITYNNGAVKLYQNGVEVDSGTFVNGTSIDTNASPFVIGENSFVSSDFLDKQISRPKIYNRALTADEVLQNYTAQKSSFGL
ncbi:hypothetical protein P8625_24 [Verrucomicrobia phage P8625]|uniref:hypothetical protein n=1 Tax=Verrucomicrobia phage P8625 TaxID=1636271 RepID=UPI0005FEB587|nr:hypothetical protein AWI59_gp24 [Verrucomicrobia phage P8625]AKA60275.1 hypothetical protein P8625_24 [Verrucomicrobia phage P8625]